TLVLHSGYGQQDGEAYGDAFDCRGFLHVDELIERVASSAASARSDRDCRYSEADRNVGVRTAAAERRRHAKSFDRSADGLDQRRVERRFTRGPLTHQFHLEFDLAEI